MPAVTTGADETDEPLSGACPRREIELRRLARSLVFAVGNLAAAVVYAEAARWLMPRLNPSWHGVPYAIATGIPLAQVFLLSLWLAMGSGCWWLRYTAGAAAVVAGTLVALAGLWGGRISAETVRTVVVPLGPAVLALAVQLLAGLHLLLVLVRMPTGWRLDFGDFGGLRSERVVSRSRRLFEAVLIAALTLATIWLSRAVLRPMATSELLFHPRLLLTTLFAPALVPLAACGWLVFASRWRGIAVLVMIATLAAPALLIRTGWGDALELETPQLWVVSWVNLSATACVAANLVLLRWCGLTTVSATGPEDRSRDALLRG